MPLTAGPWAASFGAIAFLASLGQAPPTVTPAGTYLARPATSPRPSLTPTLEGIVVDPDGKPVPRAVVAVRAVDRPATAPVVARTDASGRFRLKLEGGLPLTVRVEAPGLATQTLSRVRPGAPLRVALARGGVIEGTVRDGPTGVAVAGATVEARDERAWDLGAAGEDWLGTRTATTDAQGRYRVHGLAPVTHTVIARTRGFGQAQRRSVSTGGRADLALFPAGSLSGTVRGPDGKAAAGAEVALEQAVTPSRGPNPRLEKAGQEGRFEFVGVEPGVYRVVARSADAAPAWLPAVTVERHLDADASLTLGPPLAVLGRLMDREQRPLRGRIAAVELDGRAVPESLAKGFTAESGPDGWFRLGPLPTGVVTLVALAHGFSSEWVETSLTARRAETDLGAIVLERGLTIRGRVKDSADQPLAGARVTGWAHRAADAPVPEDTTAADGRFTLGGLQPGRYRVSVEVPGVGSAERDADAGADDLDVTVQAGGGIGGTVVDEAGAPVEAYVVSARPVAQGDLTMGRPQTQSVTSPDGRFVLQELSPGPYVVEVAAADREPASVPNVKVPSGSVADVGRIRLVAGGIVRGVVVDGSGSGVPGATVTLEAAGRSLAFSDPPPETATDASGAFELRGLPPGRAHLVAQHPGYVEGRASVDVAPARGPAEARITMSAGGRIEGHVRRRDGTPATGTITVTRIDGGAPSLSSAIAPVGPEGGFAVEHVPVGRALVSYFSGTGNRLAITQAKEVEVREDETAAVEFGLQDILITGRVTRRGAPAANVRLRVHSKGSAAMNMMMSLAGLTAPEAGLQRMTAITREDGSYELLVDTPGWSTVDAEMAEGSVRLPGWTVEIPDADRHVLDLDYGGVPLTGVVVDGDTDQPLAKAGVIATPKEQPAGVLTSGQTGSDGRFHLEVDTGEYRLSARHHAYRAADAEVNVGAAGATDVRLALARGEVIRGRVVDRRGEPTSGVLVSAISGGSEVPRFGNSSTTLSDGTFELGGLSEAEYTIFARSGLGEFGLLPRVRVGTEAVTVALRPGARLLLKVLGPDGTPVAAARGSVIRIAGSSVVMGGSLGGSDGDGNLEMEVPAGAVAIRVTKEDLVGTATATVAEGKSTSLKVRLAAESGPARRGP